MINSEKLDQRITLQPLDDSERGSDGSTINDYSQNNITVWAENVTQSGREFFSAQKQNTETQALFRVRYRSGIDTKWRVQYGSRTFDILFIDDTKKRHGELLLACKEVV